MHITGYVMSSAVKVPVVKKVFTGSSRQLTLMPLRAHPGVSTSLGMYGQSFLVAISSFAVCRLGLHEPTGIRGQACFGCFRSSINFQIMDGQIRSKLS